MNYKTSYILPAFIQNVAYIYDARPRPIEGEKKNQDLAIHLESLTINFLNIEGNTAL